MVHIGERSIHENVVLHLSTWLKVSLSTACGRPTRFSPSSKPWRGGPPSFILCSIFVDQHVFTPECMIQTITPLFALKYSKKTRTLRVFLCRFYNGLPLPDKMVSPTSLQTRNSTLRSGRPERAAAMFERALETVRKREGAKSFLTLSRCLFHAGEAKRQAGKLSLARAYLDEAANALSAERAAGESLTCGIALRDKTRRWFTFLPCPFRLATCINFIEKVETKPSLPGFTWAQAQIVLQGIRGSHLKHYSGYGRWPALVVIGGRRNSTIESIFAVFYDLCYWL